MDTVRVLNQTYKELPWRKRIRYIATALAFVLAVGAFFFLEVHFSNRAILLGRQAQRLQAEIQNDRLEIIILQGQLAEQTSLKHLRKVAKRLGYRPLTLKDVHYAPVPAWALAEDSPRPTLQAPVVPTPLPRKYTISLAEWLSEEVLYPRATR